MSFRFVFIQNQMRRKRRVKDEASNSLGHRSNEKSPKGREYSMICVLKAFEQTEQRCSNTNAFHNPKASQQNILKKLRAMYQYFSHLYHHRNRRWRTRLNELLFATTGIVVGGRALMRYPVSMQGFGLTFTLESYL